MAAKMLILFIAAIFCKAQSQCSYSFQDTISSGQLFPLQECGSINVPSPISFPIPRTETLLTPISSQRTACSCSTPSYNPSIATLSCNTPSFATSPCYNPGIATSFIAPKVSSLSIGNPSVISSTIIDNTVANSLTDIMQSIIVDDMIEDLNVLIANTNSIVEALSCSPLYSSVDFDSYNVPFGGNFKCGPTSSLYTLGSNLYDYSEVSSFVPSSSLGPNRGSNFNLQEVVTPCEPSLYGCGRIREVSNPFVPKLCVTEFSSLSSSPFCSNSYGNFQDSVNCNSLCGCKSIPDVNPFAPKLSFTEYSPLSSLSLGSNSFGSFQEVVRPSSCGCSGKQFIQDLSVNELNTLSFSPIGSNSFGSFQEVLNPGLCFQQEVPNLCEFPKVNLYPSLQLDLNSCGNLQEVIYPRIPNYGFAQGSNQGSFTSASVNSNVNQLTPSSSVSTDVNTETTVSVNSNPYDNIQDGTSISTNTQVATEVDVSTPTRNVVEDIISVVEVSEVVSLPTVSSSYSNVVNNIPLSPNIYASISFPPTVLELIIPSSIPAQLACNVLPSYGCYGY